MNARVKKILDNMWKRKDQSVNKTDVEVWADAMIGALEYAYLRGDITIAEKFAYYSDVSSEFDLLKKEF